jgi:hypothetical protein
LELALRERIGDQFAVRINKWGKPNPPMLDELQKSAKEKKLISSDIEYLSTLRDMYAHGSDAVLNPPLFLTQLEVVTRIIQELFDSTCGDCAIKLQTRPAAQNAHGPN